MLLRVRSCVKVSRAEQLRRVGTESEARMQEIVKNLKLPVRNLFLNDRFPILEQTEMIESAMGHGVRN